MSEQRSGDGGSSLGEFGRQPASKPGSFSPV